MIVGIAGYRGSGKSTAARYLVEAHGFVRIPFAKPLKDMLRAIGLGDAELEGDRKEEPCSLLGGRTPRHAMQTLGTEWGRELIDEGLWIRLWSRQAMLAVEAGRHVVCDDLRFPNEATAVCDLGGRVLRLSRPGRETSAHASEAQIDLLQPDFLVCNDGSVDNLESALRIVLELIHEA